MRTKNSIIDNFFINYSEVVIESGKVSPGLVKELVDRGIITTIYTDFPSAVSIQMIKDMHHICDEQLMIIVSRELLKNRLLVRRENEEYASVYNITDMLSVSDSIDELNDLIKRVAVSEFTSKLTQKDGAVNTFDYAQIIDGALSSTIPLYIKDKEKNLRKAPEASGVNWGAQNGNTRSAGAIEAYIPIVKSTVTTDPFFVPPVGVADGSSTKSVYVDLIWDDGTVMPAVMSGKGASLNGLVYPNKITSADGGGAILGAYFRNRLKKDERSVITYNDFSKYGRDSITVTKICERVYLVDYSVK